MEDIPTTSAAQGDEIRNETVPPPNIERNQIRADIQQNQFPLVFENEHLKLFVEKANHLRQIRFRIEDHLFHMKITLKNPNAPAPLLRDIFEFLERAFNFILLQVKHLYNEQDHNVAFLTLFQKPMINGLNTGGFDMQENSIEMVQRILQMLEQFLISNQTLRLDESFKVYLKVLSVEHMHFKNKQKPRIHKKKQEDFIENIMDLELKLQNDIIITGL